MIRTKNRAELKVLHHLQAQGWDVIKNGWPDFLAYKAGMIRFIEVKASAKGRLSLRQQKLADWLALRGIKVEILTPWGKP